MKKLNVDETSFEYDPEDPEGFRAGRIPFRKLLEATKTGVSVYEIPPGQAICPYHYEYAEEEWLIVLEGAPLVRTPEGESRLREWDVCVFPTGPAGAHGVRNDSESETMRVLMFSDVVWPAATVYPDSDKIGVWVGNDDSAMFRRSTAVDYYDSEPGLER